MHAQHALEPSPGQPIVLADRGTVPERLQPPHILELSPPSPDVERVLNLANQFKIQQVCLGTDARELNHR